MDLNVGDPAPDFHMPTDSGDIALSDLKGKIVVLYFYPKDDTSGCTREALNFTDSAAEFQKLGAVVVGASKDSAASHAKFRAKYALTPVLGSDKESDVIDRYGAWVQKSMYGRTYMGVDRSTFLIDKAGILRKVWRKVKVPGHAAAVLEAVKTLG